MRAVAIVAAFVAVLAVAAAPAEAGKWKAGTPYMVEESEMSDLMEDAYDWAYCRGIQRFGQMGEFPYERFLVFDCSMKLDDLYCTDARVRSVKGRQRGWFKLRFIRTGRCY